MADQKDALPEGTDTIVAGAASNEREEELIMNEPSLGAGTSSGETASDRTSGTTGATAGRRGQVIDKVRASSANLGDKAADTARGLVGQGLERGSEALANVSKMIGDTAEGIDERLGAEYGDYARRAATSLDDVANRLAAKDADELIADTRDFISKSPGIALAGAAVVGFALARLLKVGLDRNSKPDRS